MGRRDVYTLTGAEKMCRCLECSTISRKARITVTWNQMNTVSIHRLVVSPSPTSQVLMKFEAKAPFMLSTWSTVPAMLLTFAPR